MGAKVMWSLLTVSEAGGLMTATLRNQTPARISSNFLSGTQKNIDKRPKT